MHIQIICAQEHLQDMNHIPTQYLLIDGEEQEFDGNTDLITAICGSLDSEIDLDAEGYVRNHALEYLNTMLDRGHENFDEDFFEEVEAAL